MSTAAPRRGLAEDGSLELRHAIPVDIEAADPSRLQRPGEGSCQPGWELLHGERRPVKHLLEGLLERLAVAAEGDR